MSVSKSQMLFWAGHYFLATSLFFPDKYISFLGKMQQHFHPLPDTY